MKNVLFLLMVLTLVSCHLNPNKPKEKFKTITLKAEGKVEAPPNMAYFTVILECTNSNVNATRNCLTEKSQALNEELLSFDIDATDIQTRAVNLQKQYKWIRNRSVFDGYQGTTTTTVTVRNLDQLERLYSKLFTNSSLTISGLQYDFDGLDSLSTKAHLVALKNANLLADRLLEQLPETQKEILKVGNVQISSSNPYENVQLNSDMVLQEESKENRAKSIAVSTGQITVEATLFVEYQIR